MTSSPASDLPGILEVSVPVTTMWTSPEAPRPVDQAATLDVPDVAGWTTAMDEVVRKGLHGRTLTQLLLGEPVRVLEHRGDWVRVTALWQRSSQHEAGYPGWVRRAHLDTAVPRTTGATAFVTAQGAPLALTDGPGPTVSLGTALWVDEVDDASARVLLPGGGRGTLPRAAVRISDKHEQPDCSVDDVLATAALFLRQRYLWGGTSTWGVDCSGLVHLAYRTHRVLLPRDALDQGTATVPVPLDQVRRGDLYFFARPGEEIYHVGFATAPADSPEVRMMLHAPETGELVEESPIAPQRLEHLVSAGRVALHDHLP